MLLLARRRPENLGGGAQFSIRRLPVGFGHLRSEANHGGGKPDIVGARGAFLVEFRRIGFRIESSRGHFDDAGPDGHGRIIAAAARPRKSVATVMKPQTPNGVYSS